jgi:hypothetical protein
MARKIFTSSAKRRSFECDITLYIIYIYVKSRGPSTGPSGTQARILKGAEKIPEILTHENLSVK